MKLNSIRTKLAEILAAFVKITTDKGILESADEEIAVGSSVHIIDEEGNESAAEDGEYRTDEGIIYVVADGKVSEIKEEEKEEEPAAEPEEEEVAASAMPEKLAKIKAAFEASYEEKEMKIAEAIRAKGLDAWIIEAGDDFAVAEVWNDEEGDWHYERFAISWDEEGNVIVGESEEVKSEFVPIDAKSPFEEPEAEEKKDGEEVAASAVEAEEGEPAAEEEDKDEKIANLEAEVARLEEENGELKEKIKELEDESADEPAEEKFAKLTKDTGDMKLNRLNRILNA